MADTKYKLKPAPGRIAIKIEEKGKLSDGGIWLADAVVQDKPTVGVVVEICDAYALDGETYEPIYRRGDTVLFGRYTGTLITFGKDKIIVLKENDILCRLIPDDAGQDTRNITVTDRHD